MVDSTPATLFAGDARPILTEEADPGQGGPFTMLTDGPQFRQTGHIAVVTLAGPTCQVCRWPSWSPK